ncbi:hypothetical protein BBK14_24400 [Parafrankia soli]|uniref:Uncharacterized protein n=1 Tax=Parafrankia soli TaxID=2599596 RepID=A0A1S1PPL7_9ACTN|nr:hypothetical protein [Parafrankia soli]OHV23266.1 hypothetical protein BBK14_24400 [Parafrankia soli]
MTRRYPTDALDLAGPTAGELAAIEAEWPWRAADLAEVDREIAAILAADTPSAALVPAAEQPSLLCGGVPSQGKTAAAGALALGAALDPGAVTVGGAGQGKTSLAAVVLAGRSYADLPPSLRGAWFWRNARLVAAGTGEVAS